MGKEQMKILQMLEEGKINVDEAAELLQALGTGETREETSPLSRSPASQVDEEGEAEPAIETKRLGDIGKKIAESILSRTGFGGRRFTFREELSGEFDSQQQPIRILADNTNGKVSVKGWNQPTWKAVLKKTVRAPSEEEAEEASREMVVVDDSPSGLEIKDRSKIGFSTGMQIEVFLPQDLKFDLEVSCSNGRVKADNLKCRKVKVTTKNGRIGLTDVEAEEYELKSYNGKVAVEGVTGDLQVEVINGPISVSPAAVCGRRNYDLETKNGAIKVDLPADEDAAYNLDCKTSMGKVKLNLPALQYAKRETKLVKDEVRAKTKGYDEAENRADIRCRVASGAIKVGRRQL